MVRGSSGSSSTSSIAATVAASACATPCRMAVSRTNSRAVRPSNMVSCWGTSPMRARTAGSVRGLAPRMRDRALRGWREPAQHAQQGRLAGAVGAEQGGDAGTDREADLGHGDHAAEPLRHVVDHHERRRDGARVGGWGRQAERGVPGPTTVTSGPRRRRRRAAVPGEEAVAGCWSSRHLEAGVADAGRPRRTAASTPSVGAQGGQRRSAGRRCSARRGSPPARSNGRWNKSSSA